MASNPKSQTRKTLPIDLALQGGGSHGAFTWGVLDRILEEDWFEIDGISGTSAGAMNAAILAAGMATGGRQTAREMLTAFWRRTADAARFSPFKRGPLEVLTGKWTLDNSPAFIAMDLMARLISPYSLGGAAGNPLRDILTDLIDFDALATGPVKLFITATNVHTGQGRVFRKHEVTADVLLASACLPSMFQAIEIDGVPYWDGGYLGNPALYPLHQDDADGARTRDILIVQINPVERRETPRTRDAIENRLNEITFNANLMRELRAIDVMHRLLAEQAPGGEKDNRVFVHRIDGTEALDDYDASSRLDARWKGLKRLRDRGREAAKLWLDARFDSVGRECSLDLKSAYQ